MTSGAEPRVIGPAATGAAATGMGTLPARVGGARVVGAGGAVREAALPAVTLEAGSGSGAPEAVTLPPELDEDEATGEAAARPAAAAVPDAAAAAAVAGMRRPLGGDGGKEVGGEPEGSCGRNVHDKRRMRARTGVSLQGWNCVRVGMGRGGGIFGRRNAGKGDGMGGTRERGGSAGRGRASARCVLWAVPRVRRGGAGSCPSPG